MLNNMGTTNNIIASLSYICYKLKLTMLFHISYYNNVHTDKQNIFICPFNFAQ